MFENYVGQDHIKTVLSSFIHYCNKNNKELQHMLITGPSGTGKTKLVNEIANVMNVNCISLLATNTSEEDLIKAICALHDRDLLFIDEIQSLKKKLVEILFPIMTDRILYVNYNGVMQKFQVSNFTIIGATDRAGSLNPALLNRFKLTLELTSYKTEELVQLTRLSTKGLELSNEICYNIVALCKGVPRILLNIISNLKVYMESISKTVVEREDVEMLRNFLGLDKCGLNNIDKLILDYLYKNNNGASLDTLASVCGCLKINIEQVHEPYLIKLGLISKCSSGRKLTEEGKKYIEGDKK